ncbi:MAG: LysE family translocator [Oceanospirillaceae bacterium]|nr:LysE family translocator [Oceanospirillaceae bacterium]
MSLFLIWLSVMFPLVFSPGPANIIFAASGAKVGIRASIPLLVGIDSVFIIKSVIIGYGLGQLMQEHPQVMNILQLLGAMYLIYLALKFLPKSVIGTNHPHKPMGFSDGILIQLLNSKGWLMLFLMFSLFTEQARDDFGEQGVLVLIAWLAVLDISLHFVWVIGGQFIGKLSKKPSYERALSIFYASCLMAVSIWLLLDNPLWAEIT